MTTPTEAAAVTPTYEQLRKFAVSIVREKLLHGSNPTLLTLAAKLQIAEVAEILEGRAVEELTSPLTEARAEVRKLSMRVAELEHAAVDANDAGMAAIRERDDARAEVEKFRADFARDQAALASMRITLAEKTGDLEQAAKVAEELIDGLSEEVRKRTVAELEVERLRGVLQKTLTEVAVSIAFFNRDIGTLREPQMVFDINAALVGTDNMIRAALAGKPAPVDHGPACYVCGRPRDEHGPRTERGRPGVCPAPVEPLESFCPSCAGNLAPGATCALCSSLGRKVVTAPVEETRAGRGRRELVAADEESERRARMLRPATPSHPEKEPSRCEYAPTGRHDFLTGIDNVERCRRCGGTR